MIDTKTHGYIDYLMGLLLIILPFILDFPEGAATTLPIVLGAGTIVYSLLTNYELGAKRVLSMKAHLGIDLVAGLFLIAAPWIFGFADVVFWPFVIIGVLEVGVAALTQKHSSFETAHGQRV